MKGRYSLPQLIGFLQHASFVTKRNYSSLDQLHFDGLLSKLIFHDFNLTKIHRLTI